MAIVTFNSSSKNTSLAGGSTLSIAKNTNLSTKQIIPCITCWGVKTQPESTSVIPQVAGLNPLYSCCTGSVAQNVTADCGCEGDFTTDAIPSTFDYALPVFVNTPDRNDDHTPFLLIYPAGYNAIINGDFTIQKWNGSVWQIKATIIDGTYGGAYDNGLSGNPNFQFLTCEANSGLPGNDIPIAINVNYQGYELNWTKVYNAFGTGLYKFVVCNQSNPAGAYCLSSLPYCLQIGTCASMDRTVSFVASYCGGTIGDVNKQGDVWSLCLNVGGGSGSSQFEAHSNGGTDEFSASLTNSDCNTLGGLRCANIVTASFSDINSGAAWWNGNTYTATNTPVITFSGNIVYSMNLDAGVTRYQYLKVQMLINGNVVSTLTDNTTGSFSNRTFVFSFPPTDGIGGDPPLLKVGDKVTFNLTACFSFSTCPTEEATMTINQTDSYIMGTLGAIFQQAGTYPMYWNDKIRLYGTLSTETFEIERDEIKYQTGIINKVRDELIKNYVLKLGGNNVQKLSLDVLNRFAAYAMMADQLYVSDYNLNNPDYNIKGRFVVPESGFKPKFTGDSRYGKIDDIVFKDGQQTIYRDRCCG